MAPLCVHRIPGTGLSDLHSLTHFILRQGYEMPSLSSLTSEETMAQRGLGTGPGSRSPEVAKLGFEPRALLSATVLCSPHCVSSLPSLFAKMKRAPRGWPRRTNLD